MFTICSYAQSFAAALCNCFPPKADDHEEVELTLGSHPLALLYSAENEFVDTITEMFKLYCPNLSKEYETLYNESLSQKDSIIPLRCKVIEELTRIKYKTLKNDHAPKILETLSSISRVAVEDVFSHIPYLLNAMSIEGLIENEQQITINLWKNEQHLENGSRIYQLDRPELESGEIGCINGIMRTFDDAKGDAELLSDNLCQQKNIHCVYSVTHGAVTDLWNTVYGQKGFIPQPVLYLLEQWNAFFHREKDPSKCYLQICISQGAVMTKLALEHLPESYRKRIRVLALAPIEFIPPIEGCQVMHFVKMNDIVPVALAQGRSRLNNDDDPEIIKVPTDDGTTPHYPHGQHYIDAIEPFVKKYIETNSIF
jgi:hypothetical protein